MKPIIGDLPKGEHWGHEIKWDGMRLCVTVAGGALRLYSGSGRDVTSHFPELASFGAHVGADATFDAEAVVFDQDQPSFAKLQNRIHVRRPSQELIDAAPVVLVVFDLLELGGNDLTNLGYRQRRQLLTEFLSDGPGWRVPPHTEGDGQHLLDLATDRGLEGVVSKKLDSTYKPGTRSPQWVKVKVTHSQEFVVGGWVAGTGKLAGQIGSVLVGVYPKRSSPGSALIFAGRCGSGLNDSYRKLLWDRFIPTETSPFADPVPRDKIPYFVEPTMVVEVGYSQWESGYQLRHPRFRGIRVDREPLDVVDETRRVTPIVQYPPIVE